MSFTKYEQETIINFNEAEPTAHVYTHNSKLLRRLEQLKRDRPGEVNRGHNGDYIIPKSWVKINPSRMLSDETRAASAERLRNTKKNITAIDNKPGGGSI